MDPALQLAGRLGIAALLAVAAAHKLRDRAEFRQTLSAYALLPQALVGPAAAALPGLEMLIACGLLLGPTHVLAAWGAAMLFGIYAAAMAANLMRGRSEIDCGCLGAAGAAPLGADLVVRNAVLIGIALATTLTPSERDLAWLDGVAIAASVTSAGMLLLGFDAARANHHGQRLLRRGS